MQISCVVSYISYTFYPGSKHSFSCIHTGITGSNPCEGMDIYRCVDPWRYRSLRICKYYHLLSK